MSRRRPISITIVGWLYVGVGCLSIVGAVYKYLAPGESGGRHEAMDLAVALLSSLIAIAAGAFVLRGANWARWLCIAWMAAHVGISMLHSMEKAIIHSALLVVITYLLVRPAAGTYFKAGD